MTAQALLSYLPLALPLLMLGGIVAAASPQRWIITFVLNAVALGTALGSALLALLAHLDGTPAPWAGTTLISPSPVSAAIAVLVGFLSLVIVRFSQSYLSGEARQARYLSMLQLTLSAVAVVVLTDHLLVLVGGWVAISLGLHHLLLFYPERPRAALAAHKKFLFARTAELALVLAALLLFSVHGSWQISTIVAAYPSTSALSIAEQLAAALLVLAALIKCAQLPMHGWLIQVVEAPTPVSALLHAGIINLGGYLMIIFGPLVMAAAPAHWLLLVVAGLTAVLASLVMTTRISVKVRLAWSTAAQMGLMLVECALGLYELALLHLLAHSCYKAYCFLNAGSTVEQYLTRRLAPRAAPRARAWLGALAIALPVTVIAKLLLGPVGPLSPWLLLAAMLTVVLAERSSVGERGPMPLAMALGLVLLVAYLTQKFAVGGLTLSASPTGWAPDLWIMGLIGAVTLCAALLRMRPDSAAARRLSLWLFAGFYLDEWVTRTTLKLWPLRLPRRQHAKHLEDLTTEAF